MEIRTNVLELPLDNGDGGLAAGIDTELGKLNLKRIGQAVRRSDGMPMIVVKVIGRDDIQAEIMSRKLLAVYDARRVAA